MLRRVTNKIKSKIDQIKAKVQPQDDSIINIDSGPSASVPRYESLCHTNKEIRLLEIVSVSPEIVLQLRTVSLAEKPTFFALSYCWSSFVDGGKRITVNGSSMNVTTNLAKALGDVYSYFNDGPVSGLPPSSKRLWADAICINQDDLQEKNHQIPLMDELYSGATQVLAWLNLAMDEEEAESFTGFSDHVDPGQAFYILETIYTELSSWDKDQPAASMVAGADDSTHEFDWVRKYPDFFDSVPTQKCIYYAWMLVRLFNNEYFQRVWIVQEIVLARELRLLSGRKSITFETLNKVSKWYEWILSREENRPKHMSAVQWTILRTTKGVVVRQCHQIQAVQNLQAHVDRTRHRFREMAGAHEPLEKMLLNLLKVEHHAILISTLVGNGLQASNPRDFVYGLMGISQMKIEPEYEREDWYPSYYMLKLWQKFNILAEHYRQARGSEFPGMLDLWFLSFAIADNEPLKTKQGQVGWMPLLVPSRYKSSRGLYPSSQLPRLPSFRGIFDGSTEKWQVTEWVLSCAGVMIDRVKDPGMRAQDLELALMHWIKEHLTAYPIYPTGEPTTIAMQRALLNDEDVGSLFASSKGNASRLRDVFLAFHLNPDLHGGAGVPRLVQSVQELADVVQVSDITEFIQGIHEMTMNTAGGASLWTVMDSFTMPFELTMSEACGPRLGRTEKGYLGRVPERTAENDELWLLKGYDRPVVLRKLEDRYIFIGSAYIVEPLGGRDQVEIDRLVGDVEIVSIH